MQRTLFTDVYRKCGRAKSRWEPAACPYDRILLAAVPFVVGMVSEFAPGFYRMTSCLQMCFGLTFGIQ